MPGHGRPRTRDGFEIALICALRIESDAVVALFDEFWQEDEIYGKAPGDPNAYTSGEPVRTMSYWHLCEGWDHQVFLWISRRILGSP